MKILAVDYGVKRVGLAVGEPSLRSASPLPPLSRKSDQDLLSGLRRVIDEYEVSGLVVGVPRYPDGRESDSTRRAGRFAKFLGRELGLPVATVDEVYSSVEAEELSRGVIRGRDRKRAIDSLSAQIILQRYWEGR